MVLNFFVPANLVEYSGCVKTKNGFFCEPDRLGSQQPKLATLERAELFTSSKDTVAFEFEAKSNDVPGNQNLKTGINSSQPAVDFDLPFGLTSLDNSLGNSQMLFKIGSSRLPARLSSICIMFHYIFVPQTVDIYFGNFLHHCDPKNLEISWNYSGQFFPNNPTLLDDCMCELATIKVDFCANFIFFNFGLCFEHPQNTGFQIAILCVNFCRSFDIVTYDSALLTIASLKAEAAAQENFGLAQQLKRAERELYSIVTSMRQSGLDVKKQWALAVEFSAACSRHLLAFDEDCGFITCEPRSHSSSVPQSVVTSPVKPRNTQHMSKKSKKEDILTVADLEASPKLQPNVKPKLLESPQTSFRNHQRGAKTMPSKESTVSKTEHQPPLIQRANFSSANASTAALSNASTTSIEVNDKRLDSFRNSVNFFGLETMSLFVSRDFNSRERAISNIFEMLFAIGKKTSLLQRNSKQQADQQHQMQLAQSAFEVIEHCLSDAREKVATWALRLWELLYDALCVSVGTPGSLFWSLTATNFDRLLDRSADANARVSAAAGALSLKLLSVNPASLAPVFARSLVKSQQHRHIATRLEILAASLPMVSLSNGSGVNSSSDFAGGASASLNSTANGGSRGGWANSNPIGSNCDITGFEKSFLVSVIDKNLKNQNPTVREAAANLAISYARLFGVTQIESILQKIPHKTLVQSITRSLKNLSTGSLQKIEFSAISSRDSVEQKPQLQATDHAEDIATPSSPGNSLGRLLSKSRAGSISEAPSKSELETTEQAQNQPRNADSPAFSSFSSENITSDEIVELKSPEGGGFVRKKIWTRIFGNSKKASSRDKQELGRKLSISSIISSSSSNPFSSSDVQKEANVLVDLTNAGRRASKSKFNRSKSMKTSSPKQQNSSLNSESLNKSSNTTDFEKAKSNDFFDVTIAEKTTDADNMMMEMSFDYTCVFCEERNPDFTPARLDNHYWKECPMLCECPYCGVIIELLQYQEHLDSDCSKMQVLAANGPRPRLAPGQCPLCKEQTGSEKSSLQSHLLASGGCHAARRRPRQNVSYPCLASQ